MILENPDRWLDEGDRRWGDEDRTELQELEDLIPLFASWRGAFLGVPSKVHDHFAWAIIGNPLWLSWRVKDPEIPVEVWIQAFHAMEQVMLAIPTLHGPDDPAENGYFMWWDNFAEEIQSPELADCACDILLRLADHSDPRVQICALHGLGHLNHDRKRSFFETLLRDQSLDPEQRKWFEECRDGTLM